MTYQEHLASFLVLNIKIVIVIVSSSEVWMVLVGSASEISFVMTCDLIPRRFCPFWSSIAPGVDSQMHIDLFSA